MTFRTCTLGALVSAALVLTACGGDDDGAAAGSNSDNGGTTPTEATSANGDGNGDDGNGDGGGGSGGAAENRAVVTVGDEVYEFDLTDLCLAMFGNLAGSGPSVDGRDITINIEVPPEDWETSDEDWSPPSIRIDDGENDLDWRAGDEIVTGMVEPGMSQVDSFTNDGTRASGTATFIELYAVMTGDDPDPVQGTFEFACN